MAFQAAIDLGVVNQLFQRCGISQQSTELNELIRAMKLNDETTQRSVLCLEHILREMKIFERPAHRDDNIKLLDQLFDAMIVSQKPQSETIRSLGELFQSMGLRETLDKHSNQLFSNLFQSLSLSVADAQADPDAVAVIGEIMKTMNLRTTRNKADFIHLGRLLRAMRIYEDNRIEDIVMGEDEDDSMEDIVMGEDLPPESVPRASPDTESVMSTDGTAAIANLRLQLHNGARRLMYAISNPLTRQFEELTAAVTPLLHLRNEPDMWEEIPFNQRQKHLETLDNLILGINDERDRYEQLA